MRKHTARVTVLLEYELDEVPGMTPEQVLERDCEELRRMDVQPDCKAVVVRKEVL